MCGITGIALADHGASVDLAVLERMADLMHHRGPDGRGFHLEPGVGLGVRRLAINDLQTGDQPIANEDGTVLLVCNGEIYNFLELRQELLASGHRFRTGSDVEVIVHLYEDLGVDCLRRLRGMFAFALWDGRLRRLMLARDRLGIKPLHYALGREACCFGSELKAILSTNQVDRNLDVFALEDLFVLGFVAEPKTLFSAIRSVPAGHYLFYQDGRASLHRYWQLDFPRRGEHDQSVSARAWAEVLLEKLQETVKLHLRSDVPMGAWLSPGIDSSTVVALAAGSLPGRLPTFSLTFDSSEYDEVRRLRTLDQFQGYSLDNQRVSCGAEHLDRLPGAIWHAETPSPWGSEIPLLRLAERSSSRVKVVLTGEGADELFGGYARFKLDKLLRPLACLPRVVRQAVLLGTVLPAHWPWASRALLAPRSMGLERYSQLVGPLHGQLHRELLSDELSRVPAPAGEPPQGVVLPPEFHSWDPFNQQQYLEFGVWLPGFITHFLDRASMAYSVEARVPFLDHELVELCARIPPSLLRRGWREKWVLREAARGLLPDEVRLRPKRGLGAPIADWLRQDLPDFATELLSRQALRDKGYFRGAAVIDLLQRHRSGRGDYAAQLFTVLGIQLWDELFCRDQQSAASFSLTTSSS